MRKLLVLVLWASCLPAATVTGTFRDASGNLRSGAVYISWPRYTTALGVIVPAGSTSSSIVAGVLSVSLDNVDTSTSGGRVGSWYFTVRYSWETSKAYAWRVVGTTVDVTLIETDIPSSGSAVLPMVALAQIGQGGATSGQVAAWNGSYWSPASALTDPTTTKGDLIVRGTSSLGRFAAPSDGTYCITWTTGVPAWAAGCGGGGGGISSLNGLSGVSQAFTNDTNVTIVSGGTAHVITWSGTLAKTRQHANTMYTDGTHAVTGALSTTGGGTIAATTSAALTGYTIPGTGTALATTAGVRSSGICVEYDANGNMTVASSGLPCSGGGANASGYYYVSRSTNAPTNAVNLGALTSGLLKITVSGGVATPATAVAKTDYAPATSGSSILKGDGLGGFSNAVASTDYAPATTGSAPLKGNGSGGFSAATYSDITGLWTTCSGYLKSGGTCDTPTGTPGGSSGQLQANTSGSFTGVTVGTGLQLSGGTLSVNSPTVRTDQDTTFTGDNKYSITCVTNSTGVTANRFVKMVSDGCQVVTATTDPIMGVATATASGGTVATVIFRGRVDVDSDNSLTRGDFVSLLSDGRVHSAGTNRNLAGRIVGLAQETAASPALVALDFLTAPDAAASSAIRPCEIVIGSKGTGAVALSDNNDVPAVCANLTGSTMTIQEVKCLADTSTGSPSALPIITGGAADSILTGAIACGNGVFGSAGTLNGTPTQADGGTIDANISVAGGTATYIVIRIKRTL